MENIFYSKIQKPNKILLSWLNDKLLDFSSLSKNPNAIELLNKNIDKIDTIKLSKNSNARELLNKFYKKKKELDWKEIYKNPAAIDIIKENIQNVNWNMLRINPHPYCVSIVIENTPITLLNNYNIDTIISLEYMALNSNPTMMKHIERFIEIMAEWSLDEFKYWDSDDLDNVVEFFSKLSMNPNAISILKKYPKFIFYPSLCENPNPETIELIKNHINTYDNFLHSGFMNNVDTSYIAQNPALYDILSEKDKQYLIHRLCENESAVDYLNNYFETNKIKLGYCWYLTMNKGIARFSTKIQTAIIEAIKNKQISREYISKNPGIFEDVDSDYWNEIIGTIYSIIF